MQTKNKNGMLAALLVCAAMSVAFAPVAAASHNNCHEDEALTSFLGANPSDDDRTLSADGRRIYKLDDWLPGQSVTVSVDSGTVRMDIYRVISSTCTASAANPETDLTYEFNPLQDASATAVYVVITEDATPAASAQFDIKREPSV